jgi:hypothetical protein
VLDVQVSSGKQHTSGHAKAALGRLLDELGDKRPALVRGDSGYGNEGILLTLESSRQPYLLRLRQTERAAPGGAAVRERQDWSRPDNQGCQMVEAQLQLHGWSKPSAAWSSCASASAAASRASGASTASNCDWTWRARACTRATRLWEYAVLVTDVAYPLESIGQLYRDRADARTASTS